MTSVRQLPSRSQTTFGGAPRRTLRRWKSSSLDTRTQECSIASDQTRSSGAPLPARVRTCSEPGYSAASMAGRVSENCSSKRSRIASSRCGQAHGATLTLGSVRQACADVLRRELRELVDHLGFGHPGRKVGQHVANRDARASNTRLPEPDGLVDDDTIQRRHGASVWQHASARKPGRALSAVWRLALKRCSHAASRRRACAVVVACRIGGERSGRTGDSSGDTQQP